MTTACNTFEAIQKIKSTFSGVTTNNKFAAVGRMKGRFEGIQKGRSIPKFPQGVLTLC